MPNHSGKDYVKAAEKAGMTTRNGKGDHVVVTANDGHTMTIPLHKELRNGTEQRRAKVAAEIRRYF
jgi:predicted RNA binding protein YcfA (HicA-like mRNA interferase family)